MNLYAITSTIDYETYHSLEYMFINEDEAIAAIEAMVAELEAEDWPMYDTLYLEQQDASGEQHVVREYEITRTTNTYTRTR